MRVVKKIIRIILSIFAFIKSSIRLIIIWAIIAAILLIAITALDIPIFK